MNTLASAALTAALVAWSGSDTAPGLHDWYQSLQSPSTGSRCCSDSDCRPVAYRFTTAGTYEVYISRRAFTPEAPDAWVPVPPAVVLRRENLQGKAVACWVKGGTELGYVICFVPEVLV